MTTETLERLRSEMLKLSEPERAELAHALIESLDAPRDEAVDETWDQELLRRIAQVDDGQASLIDRDALRRRIRATLGTQ